MGQHTDQDPAQDPDLITVAEGERSTGLMLPDRDLPSRLYLLPITNRPFFPGQVHPLAVSRTPWQETLTWVSNTPHQTLGLIYVGPKDLSQLTRDDFPSIGCAAKIHRPSEHGEQLQFVAQGVKRFRIRRWLSTEPPFLVEVDYPEREDTRTPEIKAYTQALIHAIKALLPHNPLYGEELKYYLDRYSPHDPGPLADFGANITSAEGPELQEVLATLPVLKRMERSLLLLRKEEEMLRLQSEIRQQVDEKMSHQQREFFLREQLKIIQRELGISKDDRTADAELFRDRLAQLDPPPAVLQRIEQELQKLSILETGSPEYGVSRNYLDWITSIPWGVLGKDRLDLVYAREVLDRDHAGLEDVKERILEFLALGVWRGEVSGSILLLVGPPGVGKTSIGRSVAEALDRPLYRFSLGGMRDEAEIKGHRRTYIGAMPGKLVQALREVEVANPVIMLDEIDKLGASFQGDPASALLEVLDPEQNSEFLDHFLDVRLDLSKVLFICTANQLDSIPSALLDRMEAVRLAGYLSDEKVAIAQQHLWPRLLKRARVKGAQLQITKPALRQLIDGYAREAGVRHLEKLLQKLVRKGVVQLLEDPDLRLRIGARKLESYLGPPYYRRKPALSGVGIVTGMAWTALGGTTLAVEATEVHRLNRGLKLTGRLGEVMRESAAIAYSYMSAHAARFGGDPAVLEKGWIHLHVPEGATPKDGPSAGITLATALLSLARREPIRRPLAMTGELTLTGRVLSVGGIREKVVAAKRNRIGELVLPEDNRRDFEELPEHVREGLQVHFVSRFRQLPGIVFDPTE
ncbi:endopeptidase La [Motiliproteus sp. SC1-56]|uniref:endopeptidase La n=1 Tax=Motiliproteus sp. SC1-56 TaxID=2799565 RepID=UPI001A906737|nr:endopeptidase La [Motiliproteus sp. SC1-56]